MFRNFFKKSPSPDPVQPEKTTPPLNLEKAELAASTSSASAVGLSEDGTPLAWLIRPGDGTDHQGVGTFTRQIESDGTTVDISSPVQQEMQSNPDLRGLPLKWKHVFAAGNFRIWVMEAFGASDEAIGKVGALAALNTQLQLAQALGPNYQAFGDEGLMFDIDLDDPHPMLFGQLDGPDTLILMTTDDAHLYQLFDITGLQLPPPTEFADSGISLEKF